VWERLSLEDFPFSVAEWQRLRIWWTILVEPLTSGQRSAHPLFQWPDVILCGNIQTPGNWDVCQTLFVVCSKQPVHLPTDPSSRNEIDNHFHSSWLRRRPTELIALQVILQSVCLIKHLGYNSVASCKIGGRKVTGTVLAKRND
jgi:hypothetical protein